MKSGKSDRRLFPRKVMIGMFLKKLYEQRMLTYHEYVITLQLVEEEYLTKRER